jgi:hypothetical protein
VQQDGVLLISNAQVTDSGEYTCIAENELGLGDDFISLEVGVPPQMIHTPRGTYMPQFRFLVVSFLIVCGQKSHVVGCRYGNCFSMQMDFNYVSIIFII